MRLLFNIFVFIFMNGLDSYPIRLIPFPVPYIETNPPPPSINKEATAPAKTAGGFRLGRC